MEIRPVDEWLKDRFCGMPFRSLECSGDAIYLCCPAWLPASIGNIHDGILNAWKSSTANDIRDSILDGSFRHCHRVNCSLIASRALPSRASDQARQILTAYESEGTPNRIILSHDRSCNLSCPSCRNELIVADKTQQARLDDTLETSILPALRVAKTVMVTGSGDPFGSNHFRRLLKRLGEPELAHLKIHLYTNAQLWDERAWEELGLGGGRVTYAQISIDAARPETYAIVRRGGTFERLLQNLQFVKQLRATGEVAHLDISMVVQALNFREMPAFVRLGKEVGADHIHFHMIRDWGSMIPADFAEAFIGRADHPEHAKFVEVLGAPELDLPGVLCGNVRSYV